jgi:integrase
MQYFAAGRRIRESTKCELQRDAQRVLQAKLVDLPRHTPHRHGHTAALPTVTELFAAIERDYSLNGRKSLHHLRSLWTNHLAQFFGTIPASNLTSLMVLEYVNLRRTAGAANASINRELSALKRMYRLALKSQTIKIVPYIGMLEERNIRKGFVRDADYAALAHETQKIGLWLRAMFELAYRYGWRKSELTGLRVSQLDFKERTIELNPGETKNDQARLVIMTEKVYTLLLDCCGGKNASDFVFTRMDGRPAGNFRRSWARATEAAGVAGLLFHDLRRTGVRNMRRAGIPEKVAMTISGHRTRAVFERYNIVDPADLKAAVARLEQYSSSAATDAPR